MQSKNEEKIQLPVIDDRRAAIIHNQKDSIFLAVEMLSEFAALVRCNDALYEFNGKCYDLLSDEKLLQKFYIFIVSYGITSRWNKRNDIVQAIYACDQIPTVDKMNNYTDYICVSNGILNIRTKELAPHSTDYYFDSFIKVDFDIDARKCDNFQYYLSDTFNGDTENMENIVKLGGYLIDPNCGAGKIFLFDGPGASGKSTLIDTYSLFFDDTQITALSLEDLASKTFDKELLINSRVNFCAETKKNYLEAEEIKKIVTGDLINISRKFKLALSFRPKTKIVVACNGVPKFTDTSEGIYRRIIIIRFKNQYKNKYEYDAIPNASAFGIKIKDKSLFHKLKEEKSAIFNLFIDALVSLHDTEYEFVESKDSTVALMEFKRESDTVREFLESAYDIDLESKTKLQDVYDNYRLWYRRNVQDTSGMKFRINEMGKRIKEVFNVNSSGQVAFYDGVEQKWNKHTCYPISPKVIEPTPEEEVDTESLIV